MDESVYQPPLSELESSAVREVPEAIGRKIRHACIAGLVSAAITVVMTIISLSGTDILGLDGWAFADVVIMLALVFGVYRKSRISAILMLAFFAVNKFLMWYQLGRMDGFLVALLFFWFYAQGVVGTFQYHKHLKGQAA